MSVMSFFFSVVNLFVWMNIHKQIHTLIIIKRLSSHVKAGIYTGININ